VVASFLTELRNAWDRFESLRRSISLSNSSCTWLCFGLVTNPSGLFFRSTFWTLVLLCYINSTFVKLVALKTGDSSS